MSGNKWKLVGCPEKRGEGQRFFARVDAFGTMQDADIYVADNSGATPDDTEDGPLLLDRAHPVSVGWFGGALGATAHVTQGTDHHSRVGLTMLEALWLAERGGLRIEVDTDARRQLAAYSRVWEAAELEAKRERA